VTSLAQPCCRGGVEVHVADEQVLLELGRAGDRLTGVVDDERVAVEDELVLTADETAERHGRQVVAGSLGEHAFTFGALALAVGGRGNVDDQRRPGKSLVAGLRPGLPDVLAHRQPDPVTAQIDDRSVPARLEIALLVEHAVAEGLDLAVGRVDPAVCERAGWREGAGGEGSWRSGAAATR